MITSPSALCSVRGKIGFKGRVVTGHGYTTYERIAKDARILHFAPSAARCSKRTPRSQNINTVNALIGRFRTFLQRLGRPVVQQPCRLRSLARRPRQHESNLARPAQAAVRSNPERHHGLPTPSAYPFRTMQKTLVDHIHKGSRSENFAIGPPPLHRSAKGGTAAYCRVGLVARQICTCHKGIAPFPLTEPSTCPTSDAATFGCAQDAATAR